MKPSKTSKLAKASTTAQRSGGCAPATCYAATHVYSDRFGTGTQLDLVLPFKNPLTGEPLTAHLMYRAGDNHRKRAIAHAKELGGKRVPLHAA